MQHRIVILLVIITEKRAEIKGSLLVYLDKNLELPDYIAGFYRHIIELLQ